MKPRKVRKAVIAAAGFGTRFLPQTKAMPKEMLPLVDKPIIQYIVEELVEAGIEDIVLVTGYHKRSIEDHFDHMSADLRVNLKKAGKHKLLEDTKKISELANFTYVRQKGPYGNGTPLLNVEHLIGDEPFIYTWSDDFFVAQPVRFSQLIRAYEEFGASVVGTVKATYDADYERYGYVAGEQIRDGVIDVRTIIEKPGPGQRVSEQATNGGFLLTPAIFPYLHQAAEQLNENEELVTNNALMRMLDNGGRLIAVEIQNGKYYDAGNKLEYLKTVVDFGLQHDDVKEEFRDFLRKLLQ
jgi:UTP--glucose-1-phosphate uridylyltransferase